MTDFTENRFLSDEIRELLKKEPDSNKNQDKETKKSVDFINDGISIWSKLSPSLITAYEKGEVVSNYNSVSEFDHQTIFLSLTRLFKEIIREELIKREIQTSTIHNCFDLIDTSFHILSKQIQNEMDYIEKESGNPIDNINIDLLFAALHGFVNAYLQRKH